MTVLFTSCKSLSDRIIINNQCCRRLLSYGNFLSSPKPIATEEKFVPTSNEPHCEQVEALSNFINSARRLFVITGAGLSTESGIRDYRSEGKKFISHIYHCM